jgi:trk system potassium uptake protein
VIALILADEIILCDYGLNILAIGESKNFDISPNPDRHFCEGDIFVIIGTKLDVDQLPL